MVICSYDKIFQDLIDASPSCIFPVYHYFKFDDYKNF